ncbi:MAG: DNA repair protein RecO [Lachnospiraceae bacterium]|nr:DNA repair protein RecO [Lachnospiraceae bacterium]MBR3599782.1 DNA repair protein RecO [Lachnospiraceae bacterium]
MLDDIIVTGIVLYSVPLGEYDKRLVVLTKERGKITVFANGARRSNSNFRAASQSYVMGKFTIAPSGDAYRLISVNVTEYFAELPYDMEKMCYASYFCELMSYYTREGDKCVDNLNLLYLTLKTLVDGKISNSLIRSVYEIKLMDIEGQAIHAHSCVKCDSKEELTHFDAGYGGICCIKCALKYKVNKKVSSTLVYTLQYILSSPLNKIYSFKLEKEKEEELAWIANRFRCEYVDKNFKSLEILSTLDTN